jgi:ribosomal protein L29
MNRQKEFYYYAEQVTKRTGVGLRQMQSQDRHREVAEARYCLMHLMRSKMQMTLMEIAQLKEIKRHEPHNIRPKDTMYICDQCGGTSNHC